MRSRSRRPENVQPASSETRATYEMTFPGPIRGYVTRTRRGLWANKRSREYYAYKQLFRLAANAAGFPAELDGERRNILGVVASWKKKRRIDGSNVVKAVEDALFGQDRRLDGLEYRDLEHHGEEAVHVALRIY